MQIVIKIHLTYQFKCAILFNASKMYQIKIEDFEKGEFWYKEDDTMQTIACRNVENMVLENITME